MFNKKSIQKYATSKYAIYLLAFTSFSESSFFFMSTYLILIPMCILNPKKAMFYALITTISSLCGGVLGYFLGLFAYDNILVHILNYLNYQKQFTNFKVFYDEYGVWAIIMAGFSPIPYKFIGISSGILKFNLGLFIFISCFSRGLKFFGLAIVITYFRKPKIQHSEPSE